MNSGANQRLGLTLAMIGIVAASRAFAVVPTDWNGATVTVQYLAPTQESPFFEQDTPVTVDSGSGPEGDLLGFLSYDLSGSQIVVRSLFAEIGVPDEPFNGIRFFDLDLDDADLTGVTVNSATDILGFSQANVTWDADNVYMNLAGLFFPNSEYQIVLDLQFGTEQSVPEASTWAAGGALALLAGGMWLRRRA